MIGKVKGVLSEVDGNVALIETNGGVFYNIFFTPGLLSKYKKGDDVCVYTYLHVREDNMSLFGFETKVQFKLFKMLLSVQGIGVKLAFSIISFAKVEEIVEMINNNDIPSLTRIPGLGKKTAMKMILELSQKLKTVNDVNRLVNSFLSNDDKIVIDALVSLGFQVRDIKPMLGKVDKELSVEKKIQKILRLIKGK